MFVSDLLLFVIYFHHAKVNVKNFWIEINIKMLETPIHNIGMYLQ